MAYKPEDIVEEYKNMAPGYDEGSSDCNWSAPAFVKSDLEIRGLLRPATRIIDFAAGTGLLSEAFRDRVGGSSLHITALDLSRDMLAELKTKRVANITKPQDITKPWSVEKNSFDIAAATGVGEYLTDHQLRLTIGHSANTLKKSGYLAFTYRPDDNSNDTQKLHNPNTVRTIFRKAGFEIVEDKPFEAYESDDGQKINHQYILGKKL